MSTLSLILVVFYLPETRGFAKQRRSVSLLSADTAENSPLISPGSSGNGSATPDVETAESPPSYSFHKRKQQRQRREQQRQKQPLNRGDIFKQEEVEEDGVLLCYQRSSGIPDDGSSAVNTIRTVDDGDSSIAATDELSACSDEDEVGLKNGLLARPDVKVVLLLGCIVSTVNIGFDEAFPLFAISTPDVGGLGWGTLEIGKVLVATRALMASFQLVLFPPIIKKLGIMTWQRLGCAVGCAALLAFPSVCTLSWDDDSLVTLSIAANTLVNCSLGAISLALQIASTTLVPSSMRGKLGGLYNTMESLGRFLGPVGYSIIYAWSVSPSTLDTYGGWVGHGFVFYASAAALGVVGVLAWGVLTVEKLIKS